MGNKTSKDLEVEAGQVDSKNSRDLKISRGEDYISFKIRVFGKFAAVSVIEIQVGPPDVFDQGAKIVHERKRNVMLTIYEGLLEVLKNTLGTDIVTQIKMEDIYFYHPIHGAAMINVGNVFEALTSAGLSLATLYMIIMAVFHTASIEIYARPVLESTEMRQIFQGPTQFKWILCEYSEPLFDEYERHNQYHIDRECSELTCRKLVNGRNNTKPVFLEFKPGHELLKIVPGPITLEHRARSLFRTTVFDYYGHSSCTVGDSESNLNPGPGEWLNRCTISCFNEDTKIFNNIKLSLHVEGGKFIVKISHARCKPNTNSRKTTLGLMRTLFNSIEAMSWRTKFVTLNLLEVNKIEMDIRDLETNTIQPIVFQLEGVNTDETIASFKELSLYPLTFRFEEAKLTQANFDHILLEKELNYFEQAVNTEIITTGLIEGSDAKDMAIKVFKLSEEVRRTKGKKWQMPPVG
jgi:hypothetical protein